MKNKLLLIIGIVIIIAASVLAYFTDIGAADIVALIGVSAGLAMTITATWGKSEKKSWKEALCIGMLCAGTILLVFTGLSEQTIISIYTGIAGVILLIAGILSSALVFKKKS